MTTALIVLAIVALHVLHEMLSRSHVADVKSHADYWYARYRAAEHERDQLFQVALEARKQEGKGAR